MTPDWLYPGAGFGVGVLVGLTGVGGGSLMTPLLVLLFGIHPSVAVGTDLLQVAVTKSVGSAVHGFRNTVDWKIVRTLAYGSVPATIAALVLLSHIDLRSGPAQSVLSHVPGRDAAADGGHAGVPPEAGGHDGAVGRRDRARAAANADSGDRRRRGVPGDDHLRRRRRARDHGARDALSPDRDAAAGRIGHRARGAADADRGHGPLVLGHDRLAAAGVFAVRLGSGIVIGSYLATRAPDRVLRLLLAAVLALVGARMVL